MGVAARRARELRQRERLILDTARDILVEDGLGGLSMERVAEATEYSVGTVYNHFPNKDEIVLVLAIESLGLRLELGERVSRFKARPREKMAALWAISGRLFPRHTVAEIEHHDNPRRNKTSVERRKTLEALGVRFLSVSTNAVREAISAGDLVLPPNLGVTHFVFILWAIESTGMRSALLRLWAVEPSGYGPSLTGDRALNESSLAESVTIQSEAAEQLRGVRVAGESVLDAFGWRPLSTEWDYEETMKRIRTELFPPEEMRELLGQRAVEAGAAAD